MMSHKRSREDAAGFSQQNRRPYQPHQQHQQSQQQYSRYQGNGAPAGGARPYRGAATGVVSTGSSSAAASVTPSVTKKPHNHHQQDANRNVVVILEKAGLFLGRDGLVDAYDRAASTEIANASLEAVRPDIVHQCLLALFDTDLAYRRQLRVYISTIKGKTIEVSPTLRPPRTYGRFKGLMSALLRDGQIGSVDGQTLMKILPGSVAPVIPHGARVVGLCNSTQAPVKTASAIAKEARDTPVSNELQGGIKNVAAFYCISCTDDQNMEGIDYVTDTACLSVYPASSHVLCARICEGFGRWIGPVRRDDDGAAAQ